MTIIAEQYDQQKQETADRFREMDAVDEVYNDLQSLYHQDQEVITTNELEDLIEEITEYIHYDESLEYILRQIPDAVKAQIQKGK
jgi:Ca2+-binding EF-hand superfamily protein